MIAVFIDESLAEIPYIDKLTMGIFLFEISGQQAYPDFLGHFSESKQAELSQLFKLHFIKNDEAHSTLKKWKKFRAGFNRTSDNFVVYTRHIIYSDLYKVVGIVTPKAHQRMRENQNLLNLFIEKAEEFHKMNKKELSEFPCISRKNFE